MQVGLLPSYAEDVMQPHAYFSKLKLSTELAQIHSKNVRSSDSHCFCRSGTEARHNNPPYPGAVPQGLAGRQPLLKESAASAACHIAGQAEMVFSPVACREARRGSTSSLPHHCPSMREGDLPAGSPCRRGTGKQFANLFSNQFGLINLKRTPFVSFYQLLVLNKSQPGWTTVYHQSRPFLSSTAI